MVTANGRPTSDGAVREATGRDWDEWFSWLEEHEAAELDHPSIVQLLDEDGGLDSAWWRQSVANGFEQHIGRRRPGSSADGSFQIGARRTFRSTPARAWQLLASSDGAIAWLGDAPTEWWNGDHGGPAKGDIVATNAGERYEVRSVAPGQRMRLRTLGPALPETTIQLTIIPERGRTVVSLHQEDIPIEPMREQMREHWKRALDRIGVLLDGE